MKTDTLIHRFAARLNNLRSERGLSQEALASRARLDPSFISALERAAKVPSLTTIDQLAKGLNVELATLVDFQDGDSLGDRAHEELSLIVRRLRRLDLETLRRVRRSLDAALG